METEAVPGRYTAALAMKAIKAIKALPTQDNPNLTPLRIDAITALPRSVLP